MNILYEFLKVIRTDILGGVVVYSLIFFLLKPFFSKKEWLVGTDEKVIKMIVDVCLACLISSVLIVLVSHFFISKQDYLLAILFQFCIWFGIPNLLRIKLVKRFLLTRILIGVLIVVDFGLISILIASWNSYMAWDEYKGLPKTWFDSSGFDITIWDIVIGISLKLIVIVTVSYFYDYLRKQILHFLESKRNKNTIKL